MKVAENYIEGVIFIGIEVFLVSFVVWATINLIRYWNDPWMKQPLLRPYVEALHDILCEDKTP